MTLGIDDALLVLTMMRAELMESRSMWDCIQSGHVVTLCLVATGLAPQEVSLHMAVELSKATVAVAVVVQ